MRARRLTVCLLLLPLAVAAWVLNASRPGVRVRGCPEGCSTAGVRQEGPLRVMSLNVLHGHPDFENLAGRLDTIAAEIRRLDADIVCLQEVPWTLRLGSGGQILAERTGLNHIGVRANGNRWAILFEEGEAILSRYPLRDVAVSELSPRAGFFEHRVALRATADTPWGDVRVFVAHLTDGEEEINRGQAASLFAFVDASGPGLAVVAGDFNAREDSPQVRKLAGQWLDTYRVAHPDLDDEGYTCCVDNLAGGPGEPLEKRIDYLFLVPEPGRETPVVASRRVLDEPHPTGSGYQWASDHVGLLTFIAVQHDSATGGQ